MASLEEDYRLLGLIPGATKEEISRAWREIAAMTHPDKVMDPEAKKRAERRFASLNDSYHRVLAALPLAEKDDFVPPPTPASSPARGSERAASPSSEPVSDGSTSEGGVGWRPECEDCLRSGNIGSGCLGFLDSDSQNLNSYWDGE